ncbi:MAG: GNAT family N-acetyltransferase [Candidatus Lokiarchaeota archaeon]|nr:GNAT family N-acetyltransferase [Candidatus Lokiarchaeota archaeon]MBD3340749.1 GNAT family N-acetyltransferase [Candidatus Lokiarchaeota archaeon]
MDFNTENILIRPITEEYYQENLDLLNSIIMESHFLARKNKITLEESEDFFETYLSYPGTLYLIAIYNDKVVGHISCLPRFEELLNHIANIGYIVHKDFRKKGIASMLMKELISRTIKINRIKIFIAEVAKDNIASVKLLKKYSFRKCGKIKDGMSRDKDEYVDLLQFSKQFF